MWIPVQTVICSDVGCMSNNQGKKYLETYMSCKFPGASKGVSHEPSQPLSQLYPTLGTPCPVMNHPCDLWLSLLTYTNNPSLMQITLCQPCPQVTTAKHNNPKEYKSTYCSLTCQDSSPCPGHSLLTIISNSDSDSLTPHLHLYCTPSLDPAFSILLPCTIITLLHFCLQITSFTNHINMSCMYCCFLSLILQMHLWLVSLFLIPCHYFLVEPCS